MGQIGSVKIKTETGTVTVPVYAVGDSGSSVLETIRTQTETGKGFMPLVDPSKSNIDFLRVQTDSGVKAVHDKPSLANVNEVTTEITLMGSQPT